MKAKILQDQITYVRDTGLTNMFDTNAVQKIAYDMGLYELVSFIQENRKAYSRFIMRGDTTELEN